MKANEDSGIYQVHGAHVVFGLNSLLYIGRAVEQSFGKRFKDHEKWLADECGVMVRVGRISKGDYDSDEDWAELVKNVEALTIFWHSPPYNSQNINSYKGYALHVQNLGDSGSILPEYTSHWKMLRPVDE